PTQCPAPQCSPTPCKFFKRPKVRFQKMGSLCREDERCARVPVIDPICVAAPARLCRRLRARQLLRAKSRQRHRATFEMKKPAYETYGEGRLICGRPEFKRGIELPARLA